jgi:UDP-galactopyranose mutase
MMNYTDIETPHTRTIEHKHFDFIESSSTWVSWEYPEKYVAGRTEAFYPVNDSFNNKIYEKYRDRAKLEKNIYFGGRLADYKYYDMHNVIEQALCFVDELIKNK